MPEHELLYRKLLASGVSVDAALATVAVSDVGKADYSTEYIVAILEKARQYLPDWLWKQLHQLAFPVAGGRARWRAPEEPSYLEKLALTEMRPPKLAKVPDEELRMAWMRLHQWYANAKRRKEAVEDIVNAAAWVMAEMDKRGLYYNKDDDLVREARKVASADDVSKSITDLPEDIVVVPNFVCIVGSAAERGLDKANDLDVLFRAHTQEVAGEDHLLIQRHDVWLPLRKVLDPAKEGKLHFICNPQGPHATYIPLYDLVLRRADIKRVVVKIQPTGSDVHVVGPLKVVALCPRCRKLVEADHQTCPMCGAQLVSVGKGDKVCVDLGCGDNKPDGYIGVDKVPGKGVDVVWDLENGLPFPDNSVDVVRAYHVLEHLSDKDKIMREIHRVLKPGGIFEFEVPSTQGEGAFAHPDHKSFWNLSSFAFWTNQDLLDDRPKFDVESLEEESIDKARVYVRGILRKPAIEPDSEEILKAGLSPYTKFVPPKPAMAGYTETYHIQDLVEWIDDDWPVAVEPKYNGFRVICERKGDKMRMWMEGTYGKDHLHKFPDLVSALKAIPGDWILDADLGIERKGKRLPRPALMTLNTDHPVLEKGDAVVLTIFDCPYYNEDLHDSPFRDRRKVLERVFARYAKDPLRISPVRWCTSVDEVKKAAQWAFGQDRSEGLVAKKVYGEYSLNGATNEWFKLKRVAELKAIVLDVQRTAGGMYVYRGGLLPSLGMDYQTVKLDGKDYVDLGKTLATSVKASRGDIITVEILELIPDDDKKTLSWLGARVMDVDDTRKTPYYVSQAIKVAQGAGVLQKSDLLPCGSAAVEVPTVGQTGAAVMFVGSSPGRVETAKGEPFTGPSGAALNDLYLAPLGLKRDDIILTNVVPRLLLTDDGHVREPNAEEVQQWKPWLLGEVAKYNPQIIIALGQVAADALGELADFRLPHPAAVRRSGGVEDLKGQLSAIRSVLDRIRKDEEGETRGQSAEKFWQSHWYEMFPPSGRGRFVYQHHWRGLTEEEAKHASEDELLQTDHSVHGDLRFTGAGDQLWGFSVFLGRAEDNRKGDRLINLPPDDKLQGTFKLPQPKGWLRVGVGKPTVTGPGEVGATSNKWAKFFAQDTGTYELGMAREHAIEVFFHGDKLKGRYLLQYAPVGGGRRVWLISKPQDQRPYAETHNLDDVIAELKQKHQRYLFWRDGGKFRRIDLAEKSYSMRLLKADQEKQYVLGVVLEPDTVDTQGDIISAEEIEQAAHRFMVESRVVGKDHRERADAEVVDSFVTPVDFAINGEQIKRGSWLLGVHIKDPELWKAVKEGKYTSFSIGGVAVRRPTNA